MKNGGGAASGLTKAEHVAWAQSKPHPFETDGHRKIDADSHFWQALDFEVNSTATEVDDWRSDRAVHYSVLAAELEEERVVWLHTRVHPDLRVLLRNFHGPLFRQMLLDAQIEDTGIMECIEQGFQLLGRLPPSFVGTMQAKHMMEEVVELDTLRAMRKTFNERVVAKIKFGEPTDAMCLTRCKRTMVMVLLANPDQWSPETWRKCHSPE